MNFMVTILKGNTFFKAFSDGELLLLLQFAERRHLRKGEVVFREGDRDDGAVYFIEEGIVKILKEHAGQRKVLAMFGLGNVFGEMSFLDPGPRSATVVADEDTVIHALHPEAFHRLEADAPGMAIKLLKVFNAKLVARLRETDEALVRKDPKIIII